MLVHQLPPESATVTALRVHAPEDLPKGGRDFDPADAPWSKTDLLLASAIDVLQHHAWLYASVHSERQPKHPDPIPRPGVNTKARPRMTVGQYKRLMGHAPPAHLLSD